MTSEGIEARACLARREDRHRGGRVAFVLLLITGVMLAGTVRSEAADAPGSFVTELISTSLDRLTDRTIDDAERQRRFRRIVDASFAVDLAARWVLGPYWHKATASERAEFQRLFEDRMVTRNAAHFKRFQANDVRLHVIETLPVGEHQYLVRTKIGGQDAHRLVSMDWRLVTVDGRLRVFDVVFEGLSMAQTHRAEYQAYLRNHGDTLTPLLERLKE